MATIELKGLHTVKSNGHVYHYAWRGGPRLKGEPGSPQFNAAYHDAIATLAPADDSKFATVVRSYRASAAWKKLASAMIAKIPLPLSRHIARTYFPTAEAAE